MYLEKDKLTAPYNPAVVNTGSKLVVIDTGLGPNLFEQSKGAVGQFHTNLAAAGIDRNAVDIVIISHFHPDHINGLLTADNKPAFPNAEIMVPATEWAYWSDDGNMSKAPAGGLVETMFKNERRVFGALGNKVTPYESGKELVPGITSLASYGHTPGHTSHVVSSGSAKVLVQVDVTAGVAGLFVRNPGWHMMFDMDGAMAEQTRRKLYDMAATEKLLIQAYHLPFPALVYIEKSGTGYREIPIPWNPTI
jgi:glyoxylase-like metal-dependent hydrolase (beta-lactamase superfamily II)